MEAELDKLRHELDEAMPDIIKSMKLKIAMLSREIDIARQFGQYDNANRLHIVNCRLERDKLETLVGKLEA